MVTEKHLLQCDRALVELALLITKYFLPDKFGNARQSMTRNQYDANDVILQLDRSEEQDPPSVSNVLVVMVKLRSADRLPVKRKR